MSEQQINKQEHVVSLLKGDVREIVKATGYSKETIQKVVRGLRTRESKIGKVIMRSVLHLQECRTTFQESVKTEMYKVDMEMAKTIDDVKEIPTHHLLSFYGTPDLERIELQYFGLNAIEPESKSFLKKEFEKCPRSSSSI